MPANATSHRPTVAVSFADSPRHEQNQPTQGVGFRSALESVERGANDRVSNTRMQRELERDESRQDASFDERMAARRLDRNARLDAVAEAARADRGAERRAEDKIQSRHRALAARQSDDAAAGRADDKRSRRSDDSGEEAPTRRTQRRQASDSPQVASSQQNLDTQSSEGLVSSDSPILESADAGGSDQGRLALAAAGQAVGGHGNSAAAKLKTGGPRAVAASQASQEIRLQNAIELAIGQIGKTGARPSSATQSRPDSSQAASVGAQMVNAEVNDESLPDEAARMPVDGALSEDAALMPAKLEKVLSKMSVEPSVRPNAGIDNSTAQPQSTVARSVEAGSRGLASTASRAGLDPSHQPGPSADPFNEPEPLPGSVRLRGLRGARINVPMGDGEVIRARLDIHDGQVDVRLVAPEGSSQLAEQRASELRQGLSSHGMELGEFDVNTSDDQRSETASSGDRGDSSSSERNPSQSSAAVDHWGRPIAAEASGGSAESGRGALLDLRL